MAFRDHFSRHADIYASARPHYSASLFDFIVSCCDATRLAWDCATGNGQAAVALAGYFDEVIATDASAQQIAQARVHPHVHYLVGAAENAPLQSGSADLVSVAQALHWFDVPTFNDEAIRVLRPQGVLAVWCYGGHHVSPKIDAVTSELYGPIIGEYWPQERQHVENAYRDLPFPFATLKVPEFFMQQEWSLAQLQAYLYSWSAVQRYIQDRGEDPVAAIAPDLQRAWGKAATRPVQWPLFLRLGHKQ